MSKAVHIVCFDAPSPPDYGGAIELFYKITALAKIGLKIKLHYFQYKEERSIKVLKKFCTAVYVYQRKTGLQNISATLPYIVSSRVNKELIRNLNADRDPVILEGIHCTGILPFLDQGKKILVRVHNDEAMYYKRLANTESNFFKTIYYSAESRLLYNYQKELPARCVYVFLSEEDKQSFKNRYSLPHVYTIPSFIPWQKRSSLEGQGAYCLYHGNLSVSENKKAVEWLVEHVFSKEKMPFVIAGKGLSEWINKISSPYAHISVYNNPTDDHLSSLIKNAHINLLPSFNDTGVKLKLLHALFEGRFCLTNSAGIKGSGITTGVHIANTVEEYKTSLKDLFSMPFTEKEIEERALLEAMYNNEKNALALSALL